MNSNRKGRLDKIIKMDTILNLKCSADQAIEIRRKSALYNLPLSVYLRQCALLHKPNIRTLPNDVIVLQTRIHQACSLLNQLARKKNKNEQLTAIERAELSSIRDELHEIVSIIKNYILYDNESKPTQECGNFDKLLDYGQER
jgi:hypothetical protein